VTVGENHARASAKRLLDGRSGRPCDGSLRWGPLSLPLIHHTMTSLSDPMTLGVDVSPS
jgi:hypothetical protein